MNAKEYAQSITICDAQLVVEQGRTPKLLLAEMWPVWAIAPGYLPEQVGYIKAIIDRKTGQMGFEVLPQAAKRCKTVDMEVALSDLRSTLPARRMVKLAANVTATWMQAEIEADEDRKAAEAEAAHDQWVADGELAAAETWADDPIRY